MSTATLRAPSVPAPPRTSAVVRNCYDVLDLCRGCGITDFTDGKYIEERNDYRAYIEAQQRQADYLLDEAGCVPGSRILDIGCGYGRILETATKRGAVATGLTISPPQVEHCQRRGLDVRLVNYREVFASDAYPAWEQAFDGIIANGSLEHFVSAEDALHGRADEMYTELFQICRRLLRPGGKFVTTAIHARYVGQANPADALVGPGHWPTGSLKYHTANLLRSFGGWYPEPGQLESCAAGCFALTCAEDGTHDYYLTSEFWIRQIKRSLVFDPRSWPIALATFLHQPRATLQMLRCLLWDESWNYQFREPAPAQLWRHTWTAV